MKIAPLMTLQQAYIRADELLRVFRNDPEALAPDEQALTMVIHDLNGRLYDIVPESVTFTLDRDMKAGETIRVRVPKPFLPR